MAAAIIATLSPPAIGFLVWFEVALLRDRGDGSTGYHAVYGDASDDSRREDVCGKKESCSMLPSAD